ncbi:hypothetical protein IFM89_005314 [Coptis chinensis]|uniref:Uncharacterized protein n=1 Tax=Coptis chinensis TaxID=261450 RepID=A0A835HFD4_9MAGN|nr:hypothetical protein IFM89_005314 [Coptis chinensis]
MAYRRRQVSRSSTFKEEIQNNNNNNNDDDDNNNNNSSVAAAPSPSSSSSSLAAQAIRASSAHRDSSLSSAYRDSAFASADHRQKSAASRQDSTSYEYTSMKNLNESKYGFWGVLARKAKSILDDENVAHQFNKPALHIPSDDMFHQSNQSPESSRKTDNPSLQKGLDAITSSLNYIGGTIGKSFEEGMTIVENRTADIIQETRKLHIRKKGSNFETKSQVTDVSSPQHQGQIQTDQETQLKASRDVAMAMTAKAKLLLRELKTVKADLAFAKERCAQLEEENRILRESRDKGDSPEDDDLIRLQLETLLAEKARLAHENSIYARENRFLREIVEYHQLTMQDVVYLDEGIEEVTEVYPITIPAATDMCPDYPPPPPPLEVNPAVEKDISTYPTPQPVGTVIPEVAKVVLSSPLSPPIGTTPSRDTVPSSSTAPVSAPGI